MKRELKADSSVEASHRKKKCLRDIKGDEFLSVWRMLEKMPTSLKKLTLLWLPEDYLWMFMHNFSQSFYQDIYYRQYEIKSSYGERVMEEGRKGHVFMNLTSLSLCFKGLFRVCTFNKAFPALQSLSFFNVLSVHQMLQIIHPTLKVIRLINACSPRIIHVLQVNWHTQCPRLKLLENHVTEWKNYVNLCQSSGMTLMKPEKEVKEFCIVHFDMLTERSGSFDMSLLPEGPHCEVLVLAAKNFINIEEMLTIGDKFPVLKQLAIYTSSILDKDFVQKVSADHRICFLVSDLRKFRHDLQQF